MGERESVRSLKAEVGSMSGCGSGTFIDTLESDKRGREGRTKLIVGLHTSNEESTALKGS